MIDNMENDTSLKVVSEALIKLLDSVKGGIGVLDEPRAMRKKAKAEVDVMLIKLDGEIKVIETVN